VWRLKAYFLLVTVFEYIILFSECFWNTQFINKVWLCVHTISCRYRKVRGNTNNPLFCLSPVQPPKINVSHCSVLCQYLSRRTLRRFRFNPDSCGTFGVLGGIIVHLLGTEPAKATAAEHHI
jgi:hypothetical protein